MLAAASMAGLLESKRPRHMGIRRRPGPGDVVQNFSDDSRTGDDCQTSDTAAADLVGCSGLAELSPDQLTNNV